MRMAAAGDQDKVVDFGDGAPEDSLPFTVEVWDRGPDGPPRVIGRAASIMLAQAIYNAALDDFAGQRITLSRKSQVLRASGG